MDRSLLEKAAKFALMYGAGPDVIKEVIQRAAGPSILDFPKGKVKFKKKRTRLARATEIGSFDHYTQWKKNGKAISENACRRSYLQAMNMGILTADPNVDDVRGFE